MIGIEVAVVIAGSAALGAVIAWIMDA